MFNKAMTEFQQKYRPGGNNSNTSVNWQFLGPKNIISSTEPLFQCIGKVTAIYIDLVTDPRGDRLPFAPCIRLPRRSEAHV